MSSSGRDLSGLQTKLNFRGAVAANTTYNPGDVTIYRGRRILVTQTFTTGAAPITFVSAANYSSLEPEHAFYAADFGSLSSSPEVAIQAAINEAYNMGLGARVLLPEGVFVVGAQIDIKWGCILEGAGKMSTLIQPADGSNLCPIRVHKSTGSGDPNAAFAGVRNLGVNGRRITMTDGGTGTHGLILETNPLTAAQGGTGGTHPEFFDPHQVVENVALRSCAGNGLHVLGRTAHHIRDVWSDNNDGYGFYSSFDITYTHCEASGNGKAGWLIQNGSQRLVGCKSYTNGRLNGDPGFDIAVNGNFANLVGCDAQNNGGPGYRVGAAIAVNIQGTADGNGSLSYGFGATQAVQLNGAVGAIINVGAINSSQGGAEIGAQRYGLKMTGCSKCSVTMSNGATVPATILGDLDPASDLSGGNTVQINGVSLTRTLASSTDVAIATPTDGQALVYDGTAAKWKNGQPGAASQFAAGEFGDGSDGTATLDGTATVAWASKSGSVYTLTRDVNATSLTINSGVTLNTAGAKIFATGIVTIAAGATVQNVGNDGQANGTAGAATTGLTLIAGVAGGAGNTGNGTAGSNGGGNNAATVGVGGGGAGGAGATGTAGSASFAATSSSWPLRSAVIGATGTVIYSGLLRGLSGGASGGGGGGDATNKGGGGGSGGGAIVILGRTVINHGTLSVKGGNGGASATGNCGGGGGGGGGVILVYSQTAWTNDGTTTVTGGTGGAGVGTGTAGTNGGNGTVNNFVVS